MRGDVDKPHARPRSSSHCPENDGTDSFQHSGGCVVQFSGRTSGGGRILGFAPLESKRDGWCNFDELLVTLGDGDKSDPAMGFALLIKP